jgi:hypothetical protein
VSTEGANCSSECKATDRVELAGLLRLYLQAASRFCSSFRKVLAFLFISGFTSGSLGVALGSECGGESEGRINREEVSFCSCKCMAV